MLSYCFSKPSTCVKTKGMWSSSRVKRGSSYKLVPIKVYPYQPLKVAFTNLVQKAGFLEKWRTRVPVVPHTHLVDIYDGKVWSDERLSTRSIFILAHCKRRLVSTLQPYSVLRWRYLFDHTKSSSQRTIQSYSGWCTTWAT